MSPADTAPAQIALPLGQANRPVVERIVVGNANAHVVETLQRSQWPFNTAVLTGPPRSGKSLIGRWAAARGIAVVDGADRCEEAQVFHRWNAAQDGGEGEGERLLLIVDAAPWNIVLPDLHSRLAGSLQLEIGEPDDPMAAELIAAHAEQRGLSLAPGASDYLVPRARRSFAAIERLVATIDRISLERAGPATMSVWRAALEALDGPEQKRLL